MRRRAAAWLRTVAPVLGAALLIGTQTAPAAAVTTTAGDAAGNAYTRDSVRAATWNMCGEAGGEWASAPGYCPWRNGNETDTGLDKPDGKPIYSYDGPRTKMQGVLNLINKRNLNVVMLQEVCGGRTPGDLYGTSHLDELDALLPDGPDGWTIASAGVTRADDPVGVEPERSTVELIDQEGSDCRTDALTGTLGVAIAVKGEITWKSETDFTTPVGTGLSMNRGTMLCVEVAGWENHLCTTHVSNFDEDAKAGRITQDQADAYYNGQRDKVVEVAKKFPSVVVGGDFNTTRADRIQPLYSLMAECDQRAYYPGDAANEVTKLNRTSAQLDANAGYLSYENTSSKIDYLFATGGFTGCDSAVEYGDRTNYLVSVQPDCQKIAKKCVPGPEAYSDHTPLYGYTQGGPVLSWKLDGSADATVGGSGAHSGVRTGGTDWDLADHGGALPLDGDDTVTAAGPVVNTAQSFTVSAWAKVDPAAGTSAVVAQDGSRISGMMLWYNAPDNSWRFGMPRADADGWSIDQAVSPGAVKGEWTRVTGVFDAAAEKVSLYVNGVKKAEAAHLSAAQWQAKGPFVVGRDLVNGAQNAFFKGRIQRVEAFGYALRDDQIANYAGSMTVPTGERVELFGAAGELSQGCHQMEETFGNSFGTAASLTPTLTATVRHPDPSKDVWAEFSLWDNTTSTQILTLGTPGSRSATTVKGQGTVSLTVPTLAPGHSYGWRVRTADRTTNNTPVSANCHFKTPAA
ncbi:LamG-like jellyroll fold domain-containing protein [Streptomyces sp. NPDC058326]|uniref:LamG-like jellyroll fold domain-containing protein n=1 Tax=Streptomyces sp. NPDC058326 TaxID=3346447 RepID=UPI0036E8926E